MSMERRKTFRLHPEALSLHDLFPALIEQHKLKAGKPVEINLDIIPEDLTIIADRTHFSNILSNLIDNAIKYSPDKANITICCRKKETEQVEISVTDHGIGIPTDKQPHIFDKFYRVPTGNIHNTKGYGLGLFYVKTMVEKHGGIVTVRSEAGKRKYFYNKDLNNVACYGVQHCLLQHITLLVMTHYIAYYENESRYGQNQGTAG